MKQGLLGWKGSSNSRGRGVALMRVRNENKGKLICKKKSNVTGESSEFWGTDANHHFFLNGVDRSALPSKECEGSGWDG